MKIIFKFWPKMNPEFENREEYLSYPLSLDLRQTRESCRPAVGFGGFVGHSGTSPGELVALVHCMVSMGKQVQSFESRNL